MQIKNLKKILLTDKPSKFIKENEEEIFEMIPQLRVCKNFNQNNIWHIYDVYEHILHVIDGVSSNINLRLAALFHDIGKPFTYTLDEQGVGHFYGHWDKSKTLFDDFKNKYDLGDIDIELVSNLILYHDINIDKMSMDELNNLINIFRSNLYMLFELKKADLLAKNPKFHNLLENIEQQKEKLMNIRKEVLYEEKNCF